MHHRPYDRLLILVAGLALVGGTMRNAYAATTLDEALQQAQARHAAVIVDFHAPWCYSCYYMAHNVLNGTEWDAVRKRAVVVEEDVDAPEGGDLEDRWNIKGLPAYVVLNAEGEELGRILGEHPRAAFYEQLNGILDRDASLEALAQHVTGTDAASMAAAREVLAAYHARRDVMGGLDWFDLLPAEVHDAVAADAQAALWLDRLRLLDAVSRGDDAACLKTGERILAADLGCERPYVLERYIGCAVDQPEREAMLTRQRPAMNALLARGVFGGSHCADERSIVLATADLDAATGDRAAEIALVTRAADDLEKRIGGKLSADRNLADNLRVYLDRLGAITGDYHRLDSLMLKLITAYPDDYVYPFRHGRGLLQRGQPAAALPFLEQAATHAYGRNRLEVAEQRVRALQALDRHDEARRVVAQALKANGPWFPDAAARLRAQLKTGV